MMNGGMIVFRKYLMLQSSGHIPSLISTDWIDFLEANTFQPMMDTIQKMILMRLQETKTKHRLPTTRVPNGCTETLRVVHLQHVNEEHQRFRMTS
uniref:Uncharacterized protein n=1 Tax=Brassica oleracea TaxID=3712 RepID=A0A3P6FAW4_BRAOL|nr:unnamed protein product [Brassica oleracea]